MNRKFYMRDKDGNISTTEDIHEWGEWYEDPDHRRIDKTELDGDIMISTVFLGLNHGFLNDDPPILFETMIFGGSEDGYCERYSSETEARAGHKRALELVFKMEHEK